MAHLLRGLGVLLLGLAACNPALNWRDTPLGPWQTFLPCSPDRASHRQTLGGHTLPLQMAGCQADGALFAVSYLTLPTPQNGPALQAAWRDAALAALQAQHSQTQDPQAWGLPPQFTAQALQAHGRDAQGQPVVAQLAWVQHGTSLLHLAVYAAQPLGSQSEPLFSGVQWRAAP